MKHTDEPLPPLDGASLAPIVRRMLVRPTATVQSFSVRRLEYAAINPISGGIYHVAGIARDGVVTIPWSLVAKIVRAPHRSHPAANDSDSGQYDNPRGLSYWRREILAYQSGLFDDPQSGMRAARCYGISEHADEAAVIWLEDLSGERHERWDTADYGRAAKDLGRFSAHHAGRPLASHRWLHRGCLRSLASIRGAGTLDLLARPETWQHPRVRRYFAESHLHRLVRVWQERDLYLNALDRLPQTLCHFDISRHNLFLLDGSNGRRQTVAIDWASAGIGALGEDLSLLVPPPFFRLEEDVTWLPQQAEMVFDGYMYGLVEDGWRGPEHLVRLGYTIAVALRTVFIAPTLLAMLDAQARAYEERRWGASLEQLMAWRAPLTYWLLDRIDEARGLLPIR